MPYESINAAADASAARELEALGARALPVIAKGDEFVLGQDLDEIAEFVGATYDDTPKLDAATYIDKLDRILLAASRFTRQLSDEHLGQCFPGRDRPFHDLAYHIPMVVQGFLNAARGGELRMEVFERTPVDPGGEAVASVALSMRADLLALVALARMEPYRIRLRPTTAHEADSRSWNVRRGMQHNTAASSRPSSSRSESPPTARSVRAELDDLPLPENTYDDEVATSVRQLACCLPTHQLHRPQSSESELMIRGASACSLSHWRCRATSADDGRRATIRQRVGDSRTRIRRHVTRGERSAFARSANSTSPERT